MFAKQGFDWKKIENKPENWETVRELIKDAYVPRDEMHKEKYWDYDPVLDIFIEMYSPLAEWFPLKHKKIEKTKKQQKTKDLIIEKNQLEIIRQDIQKIKFDKDSQKLVFTKYSMGVTGVLAILLWNYTFLTRKKKNVSINKIALLDAVISLTRISDDLGVNFSERLKEGVSTAKRDMEEFIDDSMYDLLFTNPQLLVQSTADKRKDNVRLYPEQHQVLEEIVSSIREERPLLLGNQMPTGTGKTFLAVPLAQKLFHEKLGKTVLFACSNELVCQDLASSALVGDDIHLWLSRLIRDEKTHETKILLRPYKRCFPSIWKTVYKKDDKRKNGTVLEQWEFYTQATKRIPDIIIADLEACHEILKEMSNIISCLDDLKITSKKLKHIRPLYSDIIPIMRDFEASASYVDLFSQFNALFKKHQNYNLDMLEKNIEKLKTIYTLQNTFVAYIDEFISDERSNELMKKIGRILPRTSVIISAILPQFSEMRHFVKTFCDRHRTTPEASCKRVATAVVNISCAVIDKDGYVNMPHHLVKSMDDLDKLISEIEINPRIRRAYTAKHVFYWADSLRKRLKCDNLDFKTIFPNIGAIRNVKILDYAISILRFLRAQNSVDLLIEFQKYKPRVMDEVRLETLFSTQCFRFEGKTLLIAEDVQTKLLRLYDDLYPKSLSWRDLFSDAMKRRALREKAVEALKDKEKDKKKRVITDKDGGRDGKSDKLDKKDMMKEFDDVCSMDVSIHFPPEYVLNSKEHFHRFKPAGSKQSCVFRNKVDLEDEYNDAFEERLNVLMSSGVGIYDLYNMTDYQRRLVMDRYPHLLFLCSGKEIVFGTNLPGLVNIFIDSSFGDKEHPNTLYQLMGRAGRMGRSYHANVIVNSDVTLEKILDFKKDIPDPVVIDFDQSFVV